MAKTAYLPAPRNRRGPNLFESVEKLRVAHATTEQVTEHIASLRHYAYALVRDGEGADDLVQDCLPRILSRWHLWCQPSNLRAQLFTILHNLHVNQITSTATRPVHASWDELEGIVTTTARQEDQIYLRNVAARLLKLGPEQRQVLLLVGLEGFSYTEAAEIVGVPIGTVMSRLSHAHTRLRELLDAGDAAVLPRIK